MKMFKQLGRVALACTLAAGIGQAAAQEATIRAVSAWPEGNFFSMNFEKFIQRVNEQGKGVIKINYLGGGQKVMPPFEVGNAIKSGVVDMANVTGNFYTNLLPESDALSVSTVPVQEWRKNGAYDYINKLWGQKLNAHYLGRAIDNMPYHLFLKKPVSKPDLSGMRLRGIPIYREFFQSMGGTVLTIPPGETYTALERGVIDGYGWPVSGIFDLSLQEHTRFRVEPGFYNTEVGVLVNLNTWNRLNAKQKQVLTDAAVWMENLNLDNAKMWEAEKKKQAEAGIKAIEFPPAEAAAYSKRATETIWSSINQRSPEHGPKLRQLLTR
ncbi:TRAP transporter substrate-binding protein DctP [Ramlibacter sp. AW1]|uniref:TRAP transporter substrate-binding protein DctP n=1 Tax=Ramlibacter aurantiacus TaxID=2801330 RepID=A0A936ZWS7_9BURK|nr:TRAP transporter substrate-binding protein DctP [Ramlibacter aurantiacus]MBL0421964.1 TRAP transporter substrate-binding protein DctP [Ramlibacter aurantiacus]